MFCPKCGRINNDEDILCKGCGAALHDENEKKPEKKRGRAKAVIAALAALGVIAAAAAGFLVSCDAPQQESCAAYLSL